MKRSRLDLLEVICSPQSELGALMMEIFRPAKEDEHFSPNFGSAFAKKPLV